VGLKPRRVMESNTVYYGATVTRRYTKDCDAGGDSGGGEARVSQRAAGMTLARDLLEQA
jgi:hypothetical protein